MARYLVLDGINHSFYSEDVIGSASKGRLRFLYVLHPARELRKVGHFSVISDCLISLMNSFV